MPYNIIAGRSLHDAENRQHFCLLVTAFQGQNRKMLALNEQERDFKKAVQTSAPMIIYLTGSSLVVSIITMYVCISTITQPLDSSKLEAIMFYY